MRTPIPVIPPCPKPRTQFDRRHSWKPIANTAPEHRECCQCNATARINKQGVIADVVLAPTIFVALKRYA